MSVRTKNRSILGRTSISRWLRSTVLHSVVSLGLTIVAVSGLFAADCNNNATDDDLDIGNGTSEDCNLNGVPDECDNAPIALDPGTDLYDTPRTPRVLESADVNRDDVPDLLQIGHFRGDSTLQVLLGSGGQAFAAVAEYSLTGTAHSIAIDDLDGDELPDVATANGNFLLVLKGLGDGTFAAPTQHDHPLETRVVSTADVNGDGAVDLLLANQTDGTVTVRLNSGNGDFEPLPAFDVLGAPRSLVADDFNGDEIIDVATANLETDQLAVLFGVGDGTFADVAAYPLGSLPLTYLEAADFNRDGAPDLASLTTDSVKILFNLGDGTFAEPVSYAAATPTILEAGDFNGDARVDLAVLLRSRIVVVHENDGEGNFDVTTTTAALPALPTSLAAGDFDLNGSVDISLATITPSAIRVLWNGTGASLSVVRETHSVSGSPHSGTLADVNGDGWLDIVGCSTHRGAFHVLLNDGSGGFEQLPKYTFGNEHPQSVAAGDVDEDGDIDLVTPDNLSHDLWIHLNQGAGTFEPPRLFPAGVGAINVKLADFNSDGHLDAATADQTDNTVSVYFGVGDGDFLPRAIYRVRRSPKAVVAGDLDGDGDVDIAVANSAETFVSVLTNQGDGTFGDTPTDLPLVDVPNDITAGDINDDGALDLVTANTGGSSVSVIVNQGDGTFRDAEDFAVGTGPYSAIIVDFNSDGRMDVATGNESRSNVSVLLGRGGGRFDQPRIFPAGGGIRFILGGDLDQDADMDLVTTDRGSNSMTILYNTSPSRANLAHFLSHICTPIDFQRVAAIASGATGARLFTKYTMHVGNTPTLLPEVAFQNTQEYPLHEDFLTQVFPDQFPALSQKLYNDLVGVRATRQYFVGVISSIRTDDDLIYGFSVFAQFNDPVERLSAEEVKSIYDKLRTAFELEPLAYFPTSRAAVEVATEWVAPGAPDPGFPIHFGDVGPPSVSFEPYTIGSGVGRVRILEPEEFDLANENGEFSFQDILILKQAPRDIEGVVSGVITAELQGELSHIAVRTNRRGTPNAFVIDAIDMFTPFEGKLVQLDVACSGPIITEVTPEEAEAFWESRRPSLSTLPQLDEEYAELATLEEVLAMDGNIGLPIEARFGGKVSGFARLQGLLEDSEREGYREKGFVIPVRHYLDFMRSNQIPSALTVGKLVSYEEYLLELFDNGTFQTNPRVRFEALKRLRDHIEDNSVIDPDLIETITDRLLEVFAAPSERVRFRSSSNVEDAVEFNGAGLYDSTSVCLADDLDGDGFGPSACQAFKNDERGIARGLRRVWASLWNFRAYEERAFYGIPQELAGMAILVNRAFVLEQANGVAFTGNPTNPLDRRYVVTVQLGEESVVSPEPGVLAEKDVIEVENGEVVRILRAVSSSLLPRDNYILSTDQLRELGLLMWHIDQNFPLETSIYERSDFLLDLEFKIESTGELAVKQVRPFLLTNPAPPTPTFEFMVPAGTMACGMFDQGRGPVVEHERKSTVLFKPGPLSLPTSVDSFSGELIEEVIFGPDQQVAEPVGAGLFEIQVLDGDDQATYRFRFEQEFVLPGGQPLIVELSQLDFRADECTTEGERRTLDADTLTDGLFLRSSVMEQDHFVDVVYSACGHATLPVWEIEAELADTTRLVLRERFRPEPLKDFGPASLVFGAVDIAGAHYESSDYFDLVYSAARHNEHIVHWVVFDQPVTMDGVESRIKVVELQAPVPNENLGPKAFYLDENFSVIGEVAVLSYERQRVTIDPSPRFQRGDVDANGDVTFPDAVAVLRYLFNGGSTPSCQKSADADDDGRLTVADPIWIILHLFAGRQSLPPPFGDCGVDTTQDPLSCTDYPSCS